MRSSFGRKQNNTMLIGRFYFKITPSGNLIGEYSNRSSSSLGSFAEAATRISEGNGWIGDYQSTWCEAPNFAVASARLKITQVNADIFIVKWYDSAEPNPKTLFDGEAMVCDGMLIGDYTG